MEQAGAVNTDPESLGLSEPPYLRADGTAITRADAALVEREEAKAHGGRLPKGGFSGAVQRAAEANIEGGFTAEPTPLEIAEALPCAGELPTREEAQAILDEEEATLGFSPTHGLGRRALAAAQKAEEGARRAIEAGGFTEESAAFLQSAESKLYGHVLHGGVAAQVASYAKQNTEAGLFPHYERHKAANHAGDRGAAPTPAEQAPAAAKQAPTPA